MRIHISDDKDLVAAVREGLKNNEGYCPCVIESKGKEEFRCICREMREDIKVGDHCHCGLYIKDED